MRSGKRIGGGWGVHNDEENWMKTNAASASGGGNCRTVRCSP